MHSQVRITQDEHEWRHELDHVPPMSNAEGRAWLDEQFIAFESEPLRPTGKLLLADKVVVLARDAGAVRLADPAWGPQFAAAAAAALAKPTALIDAQAMSVSF